jgi:hypothetical protein
VQRGSNGQFQGFARNFNMCEKKRVSGVLPSVLTDRKLLDQNAQKIAAG